jgi:hypothetical protein
MQDLRVIGTEDGALLVADDDGTRYRLPVDDVLHLKLRQVIPDPSIGQRLAPRDIQAYIRSGMSAEDVATITGAPLEHIQRFEGPVLAEREFVVTSALGVPVHTVLETDPTAPGATFGSAIRARLVDLNATSERWASWKDAVTGWIIKLSFTAEQIEHDARWNFDPKKQALDPLNNEAVALSQQGNATGILIPRLRAVHQEERHSDASRFDSGAFDLGGVQHIAFEPGEPDASEARAELQAATVGAASRPADEPADINQTSDLLDALRRRRGEREIATYADDESTSAFAPTPAGNAPTPSIRLVELPLDLPTDDNGVRHTAPQPSVNNTGGQPRVRKGRPAMPTWDEIVFGARPDDDLA